MFALECLWKLASDVAPSAAAEDCQGRQRKPTHADRSLQLCAANEAVSRVHRRGVY